jgi:lipopolysaccharide export LptBFGC system permease protein LptF
MITAAQYKRKSQLAGGICLIALVFLLETYTADRRLPNPASPFIWAMLVVVAAVAAALGLWFRSHSGRGRQVE